MIYCSSYADELGPKHWPDSRFSHVMQLRQAALRSARAQWADYVLVSDTDHLYLISESWSFQCQCSVTAFLACFLT